MTSEGAIEKRLSAKVREAGGWCVKLLPWIDTGLPDRLVLLPGRRVEFVELKAPKGGLRPSQKRVRRKLGKLGWEVRVVNSVNKVDAFIEEVSR